jgi:hypothetical protein
MITIINIVITAIALITFIVLSRKRIINLDHIGDFEKILYFALILVVGPVGGILVVTIALAIGALYAVCKFFLWLAKPAVKVQEPPAVEHKGDYRTPYGS